MHFPISVSLTVVVVGGTGIVWFAAFIAIGYHVELIKVGRVFLQKEGGIVSKSSKTFLS